MIVEMDKTYIKTLEDCGLSKNDAKVYLTLLHEGASSATVISKKSGLFRSNVYMALERLKEEGLVSEMFAEKKRLFQASDPSVLQTIIDEKRVRLQNIIPQLKIDHKLANKQMVEVLKGASALRNIFKHYVDLKKDIFAFGIPKHTVDVIGRIFQTDFIHKNRAENKQWMYHIYNSDALDRIKFLNTLPYTKACHLDPEFDCPVMTIVCGDEMSITSLDGDVTIVVIRNKELALVYKKYFDVLWEKAKNN